MRNRPNTWLSAFALKRKGAVHVGGARQQAVGEEVAVEAGARASSQSTDFSDLSKCRSELSPGRSGSSLNSAAVPGNNAYGSVNALEMSGDSSERFPNLPEMSPNLADKSLNKKRGSRGISKLFVHSTPLTGANTKFFSNAVIMSGDMRTECTNNVEEVLHSGCVVPERDNTPGKLARCASFVMHVLGFLTCWTKLRWWLGMTRQDYLDFRNAEWDDLFVLRYDQLETSRNVIEVLFEEASIAHAVRCYEASLEETRTPLRAIPWLIQAILFVFSCWLLGLRAWAVRYLHLWSVPVPGRAAGTSNYARPPPIGASLWAVR